MKTTSTYTKARWLVKDMPEWVRALFVAQKLAGVQRDDDLRQIRNAVEAVAPEWWLNGWVTNPGEGVWIRCYTKGAEVPPGAVVVDPITEVPFQGDDPVG